MTKVKEGTTPFTVDSALLRELGERLVGKPHMALAELVKNSYDADAFHVDILFEEDSIRIDDNGHGMSLDDFERFWMRVGSPHKQQLRFSAELHRPLTGSKGIGRLAVQFLARDIEIVTREKGSDQELRATVNWDEAIEAGELTKAEATWSLYEPATEHFARHFPHGTSIRLKRLNNANWSSDEFEGLASEIWWLQPPFVDPHRDSSDQFTVELTTPHLDVLENFEHKMRAFMDLWYAKIEGEIAPVDAKTLAEADGNGQSPRKAPEPKTSRQARLALQFSNGERHTHEWTIDDCAIDRLRFEIRTYYLYGRQKYGIKVGDARDYFENHGGVHIYDAGFRLPYYGGKEHDWLGLEFAHAHRLSKSQLLPEELHIKEGMNYLPTNSRILGAVQIDTAHERSANWPNDVKKPHLEIQITRDRLTDNAAYQQLCDIVRTAIDFYAVMEARRVYKRKQEQRPIEPSTKKLERVEQVLSRHEARMPAEVFVELETEIRDAVEAHESEAEARASQIALLAPLATAGMAALAYEHEVGKQLSILESLVTQLGQLAKVVEAKALPKLAGLRDDLVGWIERARQTRRLFTHLLDEDNRQITIRLLARNLLREVVDQSRVLLRGVEIDFGKINEDLRLPSGTFAEWSALFQNVLTNACNAMIDTETRKIQITSNSTKNEGEIRVEDTGVGIDLAMAEKLFEPFERGLKISQERRKLSMGGTGLGLTIVRMIAENRGCRVGFEEPSGGFSTAFYLRWKET